MATSRDKVNEIKSKLEVIKKINDNPSSTIDNLYDKYLSDKTNVFSGKKVDDFLTKKNARNDNSNNLFNEIIDIAEIFVSNKRSSNVTNTNISAETYNSLFKSKIKNAALNAAKSTMHFSKEIVSDNIKKSFFVGDGICGTDAIFTKDSVTISPKEFDFLNVLKIDPTTSVGKIVYESETSTTNRIKFDKLLYEQFTSGLTPYQFISNTGKNLFDISWDDNTQEYTLSGITATNLRIGDFVSEYYSSIEFPDFNYVVKTAMMLSTNGDSEAIIDFKLSVNFLNRLLDKLFSICSSSASNNNPISPINNFNDNDRDIEYYFDFNNVEGINLDSEQDRLNGVLTFTDCDNIQVPVNPLMIEQFIYYSDKKDIGSLVDSTLNRIATDAKSESGSNLPDSSLIHFVLNNFILQVPKAIVLSVLSPKLFLPITTIVKLVEENSGEVKDIMRKLWKLFYNIISDLFWKFIREFWVIIKIELIAFVSDLVNNIISNMLKRYRTIVTALIKIITKILEAGVANCDDLFGLISQTIESALAVPSKIKVPSFLLTFSDLLPGYSQDRAIMNISERLEASGISMSPIFGEDNDIPLLIKSIIDGHTEELDTNSYVKVTNKQLILPNYPAPIVVPPGIMNITGKLF